MGESLLIAFVFKQMMKSHYCLADEVWCVDGNNLKEIKSFISADMVSKAMFKYQLNFTI